MKIWSQFTDCPSPVDAENLSRKVGSGNYEIQKQSLVEQREAASLLDLSEEGIHHTYPYDTVYWVYYIVHMCRECVGVSVISYNDINL